MRTLKILRLLLECTNSEQNTTLNLTENEEKWYEIGFRDATSRFKGFVDLLEEEE